MDKAPFIFFIFFIFFLHNETRGQDSVIVLSEQGVLPAEQEEGNSELAELMKEIEANFSTLKDLLEFSSYKEKHWKIILESAQNIREKTILMSQQFSRPNDWTFQELLESIQIVSNKIVAITGKYNKEKASAEVKLQIKALRQTCAKCHKHVDNMRELVN
ncbi:MAG: hypothetical protein H8D23_24470 [Candidatus Brocadiales bacterium]|nr:hypothetical protein [Candidatus Brocadiales bacterium]